MKKFEIFFPVKPYFVNQGFGADNICVKDKQVVSKVNGVCPEGFVSLYKSVGLNGHNGEDLQAYDGQEVYCAQDGIVEEIQTELERGLGIGIVSNDLWDLGDLGIHQIKMRYWHLKGFNCKLGDEVRVGQIIGHADNTGYSSGSHLHFEIKPVAKHYNGNYYNIYQNNGMFGAIAPKLYWNGYYSQNIWIFYKLIELYKALLFKLKK